MSFPPSRRLNRSHAVRCFNSIRQKPLLGSPPFCRRTLAVCLDKKRFPLAASCSIPFIRCVAMSIERAEQLKADLTSKWVTVDAKIPELRRFVGLTGKVQTVNMNGRALVQFHDTADIGWYDIEPSFLRQVEEPAPKAKAEPAKAEKAAPAAKAAPAPAGDAAPAKKLSPLELARQQGASKPGTAAPAPAAEGAKKLSPLEMARQQGAAKAAGAAPAPAADGGKKLSPLEMARMQGASKATAEAAAPAAEPAPAAAQPEKKPVPTVGPEGKKLSPLEMARLQGAGKK